jgi:hypothetical protein
MSTCCDVTSHGHFNPGGLLRSETWGQTKCSFRGDGGGTGGAINRKNCFHFTFRVCSVKYNLFYCVCVCVCVCL